MKHCYLTMMLALPGWLGTQAQVVTTDPTPLQMSSRNVVIYYHADEGNKAFEGMRPPKQVVYAHTGVITNQSSSDTDWQYAPQWLDNDDKYQLSYEGDNVWSLEIGNIAEFYGITNPAVEVKKLAFVFRNADGSIQGKTASGGDIMVPVSAEGFQMQFTASNTDQVITDATSTVTFTASTTENATITIAVNGTTVASGADVTTLSTPYTFSNTGDYTVVATAEADGQTLTESLSYCRVGASSAGTYPGGVPVSGAVRDAATGDVTFCLVAPQKSSVMIVGSWNDYNVTTDGLMNYQDVGGVRYFWTTVKGLDADTMYPYYYIVDGSIKVGDPYARLVLDPYNDKYISAAVYPNLPAYPAAKVKDVPLAVYYENLNKYNWKVKNFQGPAPQDLVIYELLFRDFTGTEGKAYGDGTVRKAMAKIPYLKHMGVNAVELLPINEFNGNISWGYNPNFYFAPDKAYGTPDDYKAFIDACHEAGMAVILDVVFNQSDWQHPWFQMYEVGANPFYNPSAPHAYSVLNDWNQGYAPVQKQFEDVLVYWMKEYNIDGYRFDLVKGLGDNNSYANPGDAATNAYNQSRVDRMKRFQAVIDQVNPNAYFINENLAGAKEENAMAESGQLNWANVNDPACQFAMGYQSDSDMNRMYAPSDGGRLWGSTVSYCESHDEQRVAYKQNTYGAPGVKGNLPNSMRRLGCNAAQMLLVPGAHMIWQFSELGNAQSTKDNTGGNNTDPKIVNWAMLDNPDRAGLYENYAQLAAIRTGNTDLFDRSASFTMNCASSNWASGRFIYASNSAGKEMICVINPSVTDVQTFSAKFKQTDSSNYYVASASYNTEPIFSAENGTVTVGPNSYVVICSNNVSGTDRVMADLGQSVKPEVYAVDGRIIVNGADSYSVYNLSGMPVSTNGTLAPGIYIVRTPMSTAKVVVR